MAAFRPLNVIFEEEESEEEVDDSKELQIEEALKLYQNALKLHSQGPDFYAEADEAYKELFRSEIFTYPESLSETKWLETYGDADADDKADDDVPNVTGPAIGSDATPSSLPQILYLAYKNYGHFRLDQIRHRLKQLESDLQPEQQGLIGNEIDKAAKNGLEHLAEAIGRDESDLELWRRVSRLSEYLGSGRVARFCLESVLDSAEATSREQLELLGLEERFAAEQLRTVNSKLGDDVSEAQHRANFGLQKAISNSLKHFVDPCPYLPDCKSRQLEDHYLTSPEVVSVIVPTRSWAAVGKVILHRLQQESQGISVSRPGLHYRLDIPAAEIKISKASVIENTAIALESPLESSVVALSKKDANAKNVMTGSPSAEGKAATDQGASRIDNETQDGDDIASPITALPAHKRSSDDAELPESSEAIRERSKRIKARNSMVESTNSKGESAEEWTRWYSKQLQIYVQADDLAFQFIDGVLTKFDCKHLGSIEELRKSLVQTSDASNERESHDQNHSAMRAFKRLLDIWDLPKSRAFVKGGGLQDPTKGAQMLGLSTFLEHSMSETQATAVKDALPDDFTLEDLAKQHQSEPPGTLDEIGLQWLCHLLMTKSSQLENSLYESRLWPDELKETVVQVLVQQDEYIYSAMTAGEDSRSQSMVQSIFELHLDVYGRITNPSSIVDQATREMQRDRLCRWSFLASEIANRPSEDETVLSPLDIRFLWSTVVCNSLLEPSNEHTVICYHDLIRLLQRNAEQQNGEPFVIGLVNNALMPEISVMIAEREISRITTMDFFTSIFISNDEDPFAVIERLEPLLELSVGRTAQIECDESGTELGDEPSHSETAVQHAPDSTLREALRFLERASISLKLFLWQKLRDAYGVINYPSMILSCNLRSISLIVDHLGSSLYTDATQEKDVESYLQWLHKLDDIMTPVIAVILTDSNAFESIDDSHIRSLMASVVSLLQILHCFTMWEDSIRVGQVPAPAQPGSAAATAQTKAADKFRDMIVKTWTLLYVVIREGMKQNQELFLSLNEDLLTYLKMVHYSLGLRTYCSLANKMFLRLAKAEMLRLKTSEGWDTDMPQVIFDLYGLKISSNPRDVQDHAWDPLDIDKSTAYEVLDTVMLHVNRLSMKDLLRNDLRFAVDRIQQVIKVPKLSERTAARSFNKRLVYGYLKSPITPLELFRSLRGIGGLGSIPARTDGWQIAQQGWYSLLGHIALTKFRTQKRSVTASTEDLENAKVFFKLDLEYETERWETWYRLAQVFDALLEEQITWVADKLEKDQPGLIELQRQAILCYNMAVAIAARSDNASFEDASKMAELYKDYGIRLYSSSREPFSMRAFSLQDFERPYNKDNTGMYKGEPFRPLYLYPAWKLASALLRQASLQKPNDWVTFYNLGKVLWKMYSCSSEVLNGVKRIPYQAVIDALTHAVDCVPDKRDSRHPDKNPILEPHYKVLTVAHKLVRMKTISADDGCEIVQVTPYARGIPTVQDPEEWVDYMQEVLRAIKDADKDNWHHRLVARAAHTIYETDPDDIRTWLGARHQLMQQIFTKTMTVQVWRPENERSGRHFVYTGRYVRFILDILFKLKDKENVEQLAKRIRKKSSDFLNHLGVWYDLCGVYLSILRERIERQVDFKVAPGFDDIFFKTQSFEEFQANAARIEAWILDPTTTCAEVDTLRDAIEFKKLNNKLLKDSVVEETIADIYAAIYMTYAEKLKHKETEEENRVRMRVDNILFNPAPAETTGSDATPQQDQTATKRRFNVITHREVIRRAEALMTKPPPIDTPKPAAKTLPSMSIDQSRSPGIAIVIPSQSPAPGEIISIPGSPTSVHDSADDESELSEVDDDGAGYETAPEEETHKPDNDKRKAGGPLYPNLFGVNMKRDSDHDGRIEEEDARNDGVGKQTAEEMHGYAERLQQNSEHFEHPEAADQKEGKLQLTPKEGGGHDSGRHMDDAL